jgi:hypothetical protein
MTAAASTASTIAMSSTPCAASRFAGGEPSVRPLAGSVYRDGLFPRSEYAEAWVALSAALPRRDACRRMVDLLWLAHEEGCEAELAALIAQTLGHGELPEAHALRSKLEPRRRELPDDTPVNLTDLARFDELLEARA